MGGSLALAAKQRTLAGRVVGFDPSADALTVARDRGVIDTIADGPEAAVTGAAIVVLAAPVRALGELARRIDGRIGGDTLVIDLGSVKAPVVRVAEALGLADRFVGCHPLAGTEASGPGASRADLYDGKPCFICPGPSVRAESLARAVAFWQGLGSSALQVEADLHDAFMAAASHLPHVAAFSLAGSLGGVAELLVAQTPPSCPPTSLRDTTRVAASEPRVWTDIFLDNRAHLLPLLRGLEARVGELRAAIEREDAEAIERLLAEARAVRARVVRP